jgi:hypothetical protein
MKNRLSVYIFQSESPKERRKCRWENYVKLGANEESVRMWAGNIDLRIRTNDRLLNNVVNINPMYF